MLSTKTYTSIISVLSTHALDKEKHTLVKNSELEELKKSANSQKLISSPRVHADKLNLVTMSKPDFTDLFKTANEPSISHIRSKASDLGYTVVNNRVRRYDK